MKGNFKGRATACLLAMALAFSNVAASAEDLLGVSSGLGDAAGAEVVTEALTEQIAVSPELTTEAQEQTVSPGIVTEAATEAPTEAAAPSTEAPTEAVPATEAPTEAVTAAPTEAATSAPTEAATSAPTEAATSAPTEAATSAPTEKATEKATEAATAAPTEKETEKPTEATTEAPTEAATEGQTQGQQSQATELSTEAQTEPGTYRWEGEEGPAVEVKLPAAIVPPEDARLVAELVKEEDEDYQADIDLADEAALGLELGGHLLYDIRFETADGAKVDFAQFQDSDGKLLEKIAVTLSFAEPIFQDHVFVNREEEVKVYHIRPLTEKERQERLAEQENETEIALADEGETEAALGEEQTEEQVAEDLAIVETVWNEAQTGILSLSFQTDGFSDFVVATATVSEAAETEAATEAGTESEELTEAPTEAETESEELTEAPTEAETESEALTEAPTEAVTESEALTEAPTEAETDFLSESIIPVAVPIDGDDAEANAPYHRLTIVTKHTGVNKEEAKIYNIVVTGEKLNDGNIKVTRAGVVLQKASGTEVKENQYAVGEDGKSLVIPVSLTGDSKTDESASVEVVLENLPTGTYQIDGGGTYFAQDKDGKLSVARLTGEGAVKYTTAYQKNGANNEQLLLQYAPVSVDIADPPEQAEGEEQTVQDKAIQNQNVVLTNVYTQTTAILRDKASQASLPGAQFQLSFGTTVIHSGVTAAQGKEYCILAEGLPLGLADGTPGDGYTWKLVTPSPGYIDPAGKTTAFQLTQNAPANTQEFTTSPTKVKVNAVDADGHCTLKNVKMRVLSGNTQVWEGTSGSVIEGVLEVNKGYTVEQAERVAGHVITKKSYQITVQNHAKEQGDGEGLATQNRPTKVHVGAKLKSGAYVAGAKLEIRDANGKVVKSLTSQTALTSFVGELDPGTYRLVETKLPAGHYTSVQMNKEFTIGETDATREVTAEIGGHVTIKISISRKAYDQSATDATGKDLRYMLAGSVLRILDSTGTVVDEWTTTEEPHICDGKLNLNETYTLVEVSTPEGYEKGGNGSFSTYVGQQVANTTMVIRIDEEGKISPSVTMQSGRARGTIRVAKRVAYQGTAVKVNRTFYCALFTDSSRTQLYEPAGVKSLQLTTNVVYATADFDNLPSGTYYIGETNAQGALLDGSEGTEKYSITYTNGEIQLAAGSAGIAEILNNYAGQPANGDYQEVDPDELDQSYNDQYSDFGGWSEGAKQEAADGLTTGSPVSTGDNTPFLPYIVAAIAALIVLAAALVFKKKRK